MSSKDNRKNEASKPSFSGNDMAADISLSMDHIGEETTRRVGGPGPSFAPDFGPMSFAPDSFAAPDFGPMPGAMASSINTAPTKGGARTEIGYRGPGEKFVWSLRDVPTLPEFHPLERTAVFVPNASASKVSARVSEVLRDRSIEAFFDDEKAKARCVTPEGVEFRVRLYRGRKQYSHGIIVEVQRRFGTSLKFHSETQAILDASEGKTPAPPAANDALPMVSDVEDDYETPSAASSLSMVSKMFRFRGYDSHFLALQTLSSLTDSSKMGRSTARNVSMEMLKPENDVGHKIASLVIDSRRDQDESFGLRAMAFTVLANVVQAVKGNIPRMLREELRPVLLKELRNAKSNPRLAHIAAKCVYHLIDADHDPSEIHEAVEVALLVGNARHAGLKKQAELCARRIESR